MTESLPSDTHRRIRDLQSHANSNLIVSSKQKKLARAMPLVKGSADFRGYQSMEGTRLQALYSTSYSSKSWEVRCDRLSSQQCEPVNRPTSESPGRWLRLNETPFKLGDAKPLQVINSAL